MTTIKHSFDLLNGTDNALWGVMLEVNNATSSFLGYGLISIIFIVAAYVGINKTQDIGKSLATALFISDILALILYYGGKSQGVDFISDLFMLGLLVITSLTITGLYFKRNETQ